MSTSNNVQKVFFFNKFRQLDFTSILNNNKIIINSVIMQKNSEGYNNGFFKISQSNKFDKNNWKKFNP